MEKRNENSIVPKGDNIIKFNGKLLDGVLELEGAQFESYVIYTSLWSFIRIEKLDLIGLDDDMERWVKTAVQLDGNWRTRLLEVEAPDEYSKYRG
jgi:hypothetical protein